MGSRAFLGNYIDRCESKNPHEICGVAGVTLKVEGEFVAFSILLAVSTRLFIILFARHPLTTFLIGLCPDLGIGERFLVQGVDFVSAQ